MNSQDTSSWHSKEHRKAFTTHRIFLLSSTVVLLHTAEFPFVFILRPLHTDCKNSPIARRIAPLHPLSCAVSSILSVTSLSWLEQRVRSAAVVFRDTSAPNWNAWLAVAVCWLAIPPMSLLRPAIPDSEPGYTSCADSTSGKPVVTSCQSAFLHEQPPVTPWKR